MGCYTLSSKVLLVGIEYRGPGFEGVSIETRGLCNPEIDQLHAAAPLYHYNVIIIYPKSYSHFVFGSESQFSNSDNELHDLKHANNYHDLDTIFNWHDRNNELNAAIMRGTRVVWIATPDKQMNFFGRRSLYLGYLNKTAQDMLNRKPLYMKYSTYLDVTSDGEKFKPYFDQLTQDGWNLCWDFDNSTIPLALTPEGYCLGCEIEIGEHNSLVLTPPVSEASIGALIQSMLGLSSITINRTKPKYHGIFLSHTRADKPFVRQLRKSLLDQGVENVWIDEAEIMLGDSLIAKIQEGINRSEYFGIVLSPRSIDSSWVQRELEQAMNIEIGTHSVKVLPLLYERCELPGFLRGKVYADFTTGSKYEDSLNMILRRLEIME